MNALLLAQALGYLLAGGMAWTIPTTSGVSSADRSSLSWRRFAVFAGLHGLALWVTLLQQIMPLSWLPCLATGLDLLAALCLVDAATHLAGPGRSSPPRIMVVGACIVGLAGLGKVTCGTGGLGWPLVAAALVATWPRFRHGQPWMPDRLGHLAMQAALAALVLTAGPAAWMGPSPVLDLAALLPLSLLVPALFRAMRPPSSSGTTSIAARWRHPLTLALPCMVIGITVGCQILDEHAELLRSNLAATARRDLDLVDNSLREHWSRNSQTAAFISSWPEALSLLAPEATDPGDRRREADRKRLEARIDALVISQGLSIVYLLNASGTVCLTSNRGTPNSLEGKNYAFRAYFTDAVANGTGRLVSVGTTTGRRGFYTSAALRTPDGRLAGVAVVKQDLDQFDALLRPYPAIVLIDANGQVAASGHRPWIGRILASEVPGEGLPADSRRPSTPGLEPILAGPPRPGRIQTTDDRSYFCTLSANETESCRLMALTDLGPDQRSVAWLLVLVTLANLLIMTVFIVAEVLVGHSQSLRRSRTLLHEIIERATDAIIVLRRMEDGSCQVVLTNPMARRHLSTATPILPGQPWHVLTGLAHEPWLNEAINRSWASDHITVIEQATGQGSEERWLRCTLARHDNQLTLTITDITSHRHTEEERRRQRDFIRRILDADPNPVMLRAPDGHCLFVNRACSELMGLGAEDITGKHPSEFLPVPEEADVLTAGDQDVLDQGHQCDSEVSLTLADGRVRIFKLTKRPMRLADGRNCIYGSATDITALRSAVDDAQRARLEAEVATRAKDGFLATMGHEIRTPLNGVLGMLQLLQRTTLSTLQDDYTHTARRSAEALLGLLNDLLDFSKIEAGHLDLEHTPFDLRQAVHDTMDQLHGRYDPARIELAVRIAPDLPGFIDGDVLRFRQILANLTGNALKFTEQGHVLIQLDQEVTGSLRHLRLRISDTGIGISQGQQHRLFRAFEMGDASTTRRFGGTGLGLALSKRLVDLMGGTIAVASQPGHGSTFTLLLPLHDGDAPEATTSLAHRRILVVDDQDVARTATCEALEAAGAVVTAYASGGELLATLFGASHDDPVHSVVIDQLMPDMSGEDVARAIRSDPRLNQISLILALALPARCTPSQAAEIGCDGYLPKPLRGDELSAMIADVERRRAAGDHTLVMRETLALANVPLTSLISGALLDATVLLVDDNPVNAEVARALVARCCTTVLVADNGYRALDIIENQPVDLVLMDVQMPGMDGFATTAAIRRRETEADATGPNRKHLPIIALTGSLTNDARTLCREAGMDDHCKKPLTEETFQVLLARWLDRGDTPPPSP